MPRFCRFTCILSLFFIAQSVFSATREYRSHIESSNWRLTTENHAKCVLTQDIPMFGNISFIHKSGNDIQAKLVGQPLFLSSPQVSIMAEPAPWRHDGMSFQIGQYRLNAGHDLLTVNSPHASRMFQQLENGMVTTLHYKDTADQRDTIVLSISPMKLRKYLKDFRACELTLFEYDPDFIVDFNIYFATNRSELTAKAKKNLAYAVKHMLFDKELKQFRVDTHADNRGRRRFNDKLSQRRADAIKKYLLELGLDEKLLYIEAHGEREPKYSNDTSSGRAKNRHAQIQLLKQPIAVKKEEKEQVEDDYEGTDQYNTPIPNFINLNHLITK